MKRSVLFGVFLALVVAAVAFAQGKPDFSGTWTPDPSLSSAPPAGGGRMGGGGGGPMTVKQTDTELSIERQGRQGAQTTTYKLDGTPTTSETQRGKSTSTAKWDGSKLVITTKMETQQGAMETTQTWSLEGGNLVVERKMGENTSKTVYKKG